MSKLLLVMVRPAASVAVSGRGPAAALGKTVTFSETLLSSPRLHSAFGDSAFGADCPSPQLRVTRSVPVVKVIGPGSMPGWAGGGYRDGLRCAVGDQVGGGCGERGDAGADLQADAQAALRTGQPDLGLSTGRWSGRRLSRR